ncbi:hypothetical protein ACN27F_23730 [Solwaraspora sp. WMMB335]|uniref:hypothetical protein n=1 Tax=Solwaraspora sp. WMMB335 TaxID=3404118 RepID=UPI003B953BBD
MTTVGDDVRDDDGWLAAGAPRRWTNRVTPWLAAGLLLAAGFAAGVTVPQRDAGATARPGQRAAGGGQYQAGGGQFQPPGGQQSVPAADGGRESAATGVVKLVDGDTVYVETEAGTVVIVRTDDDTAVRVPASLDGLAVGAAVTVEGETAADGTVSAESIVASD